jgi:hypothetical protein
VQIAAVLQAATGLQLLQAASRRGCCRRARHYKLLLLLLLVVVVVLLLLSISVPGLLEVAPPPAAHEPAAAAVQPETDLLLEFLVLVVLLGQLLLRPTPWLLYQHAQHLAQPRQQAQHLARQALAQLGPNEGRQCFQAQPAHSDPLRLLAEHAAAAAATAVAGPGCL